MAYLQMHDGLFPVQPLQLQELFFAISSAKLLAFCLVLLWVSNNDMPALDIVNAASPEPFMAPTCAPRSAPTTAPTAAPICSFETSCGAFIGVGIPAAPPTRCATASLKVVPTFINSFCTSEGWSSFLPSFAAFSAFSSIF